MNPLKRIIAENFTANLLVGGEYEQTHENIVFNSVFTVDAAAFEEIKPE